MTDQNTFKLENVAPVFQVADIKRALGYYSDKLLFSTDFEWSNSENEPVNYAIVLQGDTELHLTPNKEPHERVAYFFVRNVQAFHEAVKAKGADITRGITDLPWQMREFEVTDPDGNRLIFGEHLSPAA